MKENGWSAQLVVVFMGLRRSLHSGSFPAQEGRFIWQLVGVLAT